MGCLPAGAAVPPECSGRHPGGCNDDYMRLQAKHDAGDSSSTHCLLVELNDGNPAPAAGPCDVSSADFFPQRSFHDVFHPQAGNPPLDLSAACSLLLETIPVRPHLPGKRDSADPKGQEW